jgi:hypothetical protein
MAELDLFYEIVPSSKGVDDGWPSPRVVGIY